MAPRRCYPAVNVSCTHLLFCSSHSSVMLIALLSDMFGMLAHCMYLDTRENGLQLIFGHVHKLAWPLISSGIAQQVQRCQPCLPPAVLRVNNIQSIALATAYCHDGDTKLTAKNLHVNLKPSASTAASISDGRHEQPASWHRQGEAHLLTKTSTGLIGECVWMAAYAGLFMVAMRGQ